MSDRRSDLHLHEQLLLLALRDEKGSLESKASMHAYALGGAILTELCLVGRIRIDGGKKRMVDILDRASLGDAVLDDCLTMVATAKRRASAATWVARFANVKRLRHRVAEGLCRRGILGNVEDKVLLFFTRKRYPTIDPEPERRLVERVRAAVFGDSAALDADTAIVVTLANATGLMRVHFDRKQLKARKQRLESIAKGNMAGAATREAVRAAEQAAMAVIAATTATNAASIGH